MMPPKVRQVHDLHFMEEGGNFCVIFPPKEGESEPSEIQTFFPLALVDRSVQHGYDPDDEDWEWRVVSHLLHEIHTDAPPAALASRNYRRGIVESAAVADTVTSWKISDEHLNVVRQAMGAKEDIRARMAEHREMLSDMGIEIPSLPMQVDPPQ